LSSPLVDAPTGAWSNVLVEYRILGPLEVVGADAPIPIPAGKPRALLQLLLLSANEVVPTGRLVDGLWGDDPPPSAEHAIEVYVSQLRRALGPDAISTGPGGYAIHLGADELDLDRFQRLAAEARIARDQDDPAKATGLLRRAEGLWRGSALAELPPTPTARAAVVRLEELRIAATEQRVDAMLATGNHRELIPELESLVSAHPYRERLRAQQMLALYRAGRQADALAAYHQARTILGDALGLEPGEELQALQLAVLRQDASLGASRPPTVEHIHPRKVASRWPRAAPALVVGAVITAVLVAAGVISSSGARPNELLAGDDLRLASQLPGAVRDDCRPASVQDGSLGGVTSLHCNLPLRAEADEVWFDRFATQAALDVAFRRLVADVGSPSYDDCQAGPWPAVEPWEVLDEPKGTVLCHANGGPAWFVWTYESERLLARALRSDGDIKALWTWWHATARFLREGDAPSA
jgi:DNA-binding SARP family transcriptional activator